jgi:hypothetical protein
LTGRSETASDAGAATRAVARVPGQFLHVAGKHAESEAKYDEAAKAAGITLQKKQQ